jgi:hypothetical protein
VKKRPTKSRNSKGKRESRATFPPISQDMKEWSAMLQSELYTWLGITTKSMFGFLSFYRNGTIFAALPQTRGFSSSSSFILKFNPIPSGLLKRAQSDPRMDTNTRLPGKGWFSFELHSTNDLRDALFWLNHAYESARK